MILLRSIKIRNYRNVKDVKLENLNNLNILIGPNNCGKTNILKAIEILSKVKTSEGTGYGCNKCDSFRHIENKDGEYKILGIHYDSNINEAYKRKRGYKIDFTFDKAVFEGVERSVFKDLEKKLKTGNYSDAPHLDEILRERNLYTLSLESEFPNRPGEYGVGKHISLFSVKNMGNQIKKRIVFCPDSRLQTYKGYKISDYVLNSRPRKGEETKLIDFIKEIVDPKIIDRILDIDKKEVLLVDRENFESSMTEQGSGIRSLFCLGWDIVRAKKGSVVLIDEPELGLNPFAKQEFLKLLLEQSKTKQIFIATQDPTFVNPILWKTNEVVVYFYSLINENFFKIDLNQNKEDPNTFAGYLPHTVSLKDTHIYVEGSSDVYIFQILMERYLKEERHKNWIKIANRIGIYHLCGGFWEHLLYTVPKPPYKCIVVLDGDKRKDVENVCGKYNENTVNVSKFEFCKDIKDVKKSFGKESHPIYCLKEDCIERYFNPRFNCSKPPKRYNKKVEGPKKAEEIDKISKEMRDLFEIITSG